MTFYVENETEEKFPFDEKELLKSLVNAVLESEAVPFKDITVNLTFCDEETIQETNREFRKDVYPFHTIGKTRRIFQG